MSTIDHSSFLRSLQARMRVRGAEQLSEQTPNQEERTRHSSENVFHHTNEETSNIKHMTIPSMRQEKYAPTQTSSFICDRRLFQLARGQEVDITCGDSTLGSYTITPLHNKSSHDYNKQSNNNNSNNCKSMRLQRQELNHVQNVTSSNTNYYNVGANNDMHKLTQSRKVQTTENLARAGADANANDTAHVSLQSNLPLESRYHKENNEHINKRLQMHLVSHNNNYNNYNNQKQDEKSSNYSPRGSRYTIFPFKQEDVIDSITERYCTQPYENIDNNCDNNNDNFNNDIKDEKKVSFAYVQSTSDNNCFDINRTNESVESRSEVVALTHPCNNTTLPTPPIIIHYHFANQGNSQSDNDANALAPLHKEKYITTKSSSPLENVRSETAGNMIHAKIMNEDQANSNTSTSATLGQLETSHNTPRSISVHPASSPTAISTMEPLPPSSAEVELTSIMNTNANTNEHKTENTNNTTIPNQGLDATEGKQHEQKESKNIITSTFLPNTNVDIKKIEDFDHSLANGGNSTTNTANNSYNDNDKKENKKEEQTSLTAEQEREAMLLRNASRYVQSLEHKIDAQMSSFESHIQLLNEESARNALLRKDRDLLLKLAHRLQGEKAQLQHWLMSHSNTGNNLHYNIKDDDTNNNQHNKKQRIKNSNVQEDVTHFIATPAATNTCYRNLQSKDTARRNQKDKHVGLNFSSYNFANSTLSSSSSSSSSSSQILQDRKLAKAAECNYIRNRKCNKESDTANLHKSTTLPNYTVTAQGEKLQVPLPDAVRAIYESTMQENLTCANAKRNQPEEMSEQHAQENKIHEEQQHTEKVHQKETHIEVANNARANHPSKVTSSAELSENSRQNTEKHNAINIGMANLSNNNNEINDSNNNKMHYDQNSVTRAKQRLTELEKYVDQLWREAQMSNESRSEDLYSKQLNYANHNFNYHAENVDSYKHVMPHSVLAATLTAPVHETIMNNKTSVNRNGNWLNNNIEGMNTSTKSSAFRNDVESKRYEHAAHATPNKKTDGSANNDNNNDNNKRKYKYFAEVQQLLTEIAHERAVIKSETEQWHQYLQHALPSQTSNLHNLATSNLENEWLRRGVS